MLQKAWGSVGDHAETVQRADDRKTWLWNLLRDVGQMSLLLYTS